MTGGSYFHAPVVLQNDGLCSRTLSKLDGKKMVLGEKKAISVLFLGLKYVPVSPSATVSAFVKSDDKAFTSLLQLPIFYDLS